MKTAISIPDPLFQQAEHLAHQLGVSRSELYARAVAALVAALQTQRVTEALDQLYAVEDSRLDAAVAQIQAASLPNEVW